MCTNGVNTNQLKGTLVQIDETVALCRKWTHRMYHLANDGQMTDTAAKLAGIQSQLDELRASLSDCQDIVDEEDGNLDVTVELV